MAGRFPGARDIDAYWANLRDGVESIHVFTEQDLLAAGESPARLRDPSYVKACGRLDDIDKFDAAFFGMSPRDAAVFDPQHRLFLECAWEAFENAGYVAEKAAGAVGVFASSGGSEYLMHNLLPNREVMESMGAWLVRHTGNDASFLATRVSYELNLRGPSMSIQSACSSSLLAVHAACQSLLNGECDMALAGGATVYPEQNRGYLFRQGEILSPDGHCRAFDARAAGTVMASAVGCVVLKRLEDALRDGDNVLSIVLGSAANNDGSDKVGYLAPSVTGQARVVSEALAVAGVDAEDVTYIETHGTGTLIGDPIEVKALTEAFRASTDKRQFCAIGSVKTNIGHAGEAAGICGFIKTVLALGHRQIPPSLHYDQPNPQVDFAASPFFVNATLRSWDTPGAGIARIAGVTALGAGGTNVHVLLREPPRLAAPRPDGSPQLLLVSTRTQAGLERASARLAAHLRANPGLPLGHVAHTLLAGRQGFEFRRVVVAADTAGAAEALEAGDDPKRSASGRATLAHAASSPRIVFMFPGGGSQYGGMGAALHAQPVYREAVDACLTHLPLPVAEQIRSLLLASPSEAAQASLRLESPTLALPALFATEYAIARLLESWGIVPAAMIGHSAGEYAAACLAGVFALRDAVALVALRGRLFEKMPAGAMLSVGLPEHELTPLLEDGVSLAAVNGPALCVASGPSDAVARLEVSLREREIECARVHLPIAAHSAMVGLILGEFADFCRTIPLYAPRTPFVSNLTGTWITDSEATDPDYWVRHLRQTVRFNDGIRKILETGNQALLEIGPGRTLSAFARQQTARSAAIATTMRHPLENASDVAVLLGALGRLWVSGVALDETKLFAPEARRRASLPTYPFERQRYWVDPDHQASSMKEDTPELRKRPDVGDWFYAPSWGRSAPACADGAPRAPATWLVCTDHSPLARRLVDRLRSRLEDRVVTLSAGRGFAATGKTAFSVAPTSASDFEALARELRRLNMAPGRVVHLWSLANRRRMRRRTMLRTPPGLRGYSRSLALDYYSLVFLARAFAGEAEALRVDIVSSHMHALPGDRDFAPEKAVLLGARKVLPREYPQLVCTSIDVAEPEGPLEEERLVSQLEGELEGAASDDDVAWRGPDRWIRRFDRVRLPDAPGTQAWLRQRGVYLVTGGLGGLGLSVAEHLARTAKAKIVLVGRRSLTPGDARSDRVQSIRTLGGDVLVFSADVTDLRAMREVVARTHARFGRIDGVFHAAGQLRDELVALRAPVAESAVIDTKVKGALVLDAVLRKDDPELFVLFSSVSSILGLPGQADYSAANAFLDAFALARAARRPDHRTLSIDWNAWKDVGMLAPTVTATVGLDGARPVACAPAPPAHPMLLEVLEDSPQSSLYRSALRPGDHWLLHEHVVRGGAPLIPGAGLLDLARAALQARPSPQDADPPSVELRDVLFLAPFSVREGEVRVLHIRIDRAADGAFVMYGESEEETFVRGKVAYTRAQAPARADLDAIRARCIRDGAAAGGRLVQHFMDFGPRWSCVESIRLGDHEAIVELTLPASYASELEVFRLHPALLDMATGGAQALVPGFDPAAHFYVPFSYGRLLLHRPLPARITSHVRLRANSSKDSPVFDAVIHDGAGDEVARIEGFIMRRAAFGQAGESPRQAALRVGMTPAEGIEALDRMLAVPVAPQIVACTVDLETWLERLAADARSPGTDRRGAGAGGPRFARPPVGATFVAPRDPVERELAVLWQELLGVSEVGIHDDFFELGGQSLIAVRMFHRIGKKYGVELPLATLFEAPTIAHAAAVVRSRVGVSEEAPPVEATPPTAASALVTIQPGGGSTPFFCVHGAGGNVLNFRDLARAMDVAQPFYGLQAQGVDGLASPHETIEDMAASYLAEVRALQPEGPYLLGGYSGGGLVAFEMARLLTEAGQDVKLLALLDTFAPDKPVRAVTMRMRAARLREEGLAYVAEFARGRIGALQQHRMLRAIEKPRARGQPVPLALRDFYVSRSFEKAALRFRPKTWSGRATLFRASRPAYVHRDGGPFYGWERHILGGVEVVEVPGDHATFVLGANAGVVARALSEAIAKVRPAAQSTVAREAPVFGLQAPA
jgi:acyl transferase domain-containing protein/thioesterase domain-containing protein